MSAASPERVRHRAPSIHQRRDACFGCGSRRLSVFLQLGPTPLANAFLRSSEEFAAEPRYPLDLCLCEDCSLVQIVDLIDRRVLFSHYLYLTGTSETMAAHNRAYAETVIRLLDMQPTDLVVEIASNDGSLLRHFKALGVRTLGVEPAANIAGIARDAGIDTLTQFFSSATAGGLVESHGTAKAVVANNVLAHVDDPLDFLKGCRSLAGNSGSIVIEVPYIGELIDRLAYDTVYHEHLCYFSATSLLHMCDVAALTLARLDRVPVHGGSLRVFLRAAATRHAHCEAALALAASERAAGLDRLPRYQRFAEDVQRNREGLRDLLTSLAQARKAVAAYGAPAKGNTLLNFCGIGTDLVAYTVDKNPLKIGLITPGMHLPIYPVETLVERRPDCALLLAWNFAEEIVSQQRDYLDRGGRFVLPIPAPRFLT